MNGVRRLLSLLLLAGIAAPVMAATITSALSQFYNPGQPFTVSLSVTPDAGTQAQAMEDLPPTGWGVSSISHGGSFDTVSGKVKWGPFTDANSRTLTYLVTPPANAVGEKTFHGLAVFNSTTVVITGARTTRKFPGTLARLMPADYVPGVPVSVTLNLTPAADVNAWAAEEQVPANWVVTGISHGGAFDRANLRVKWGPFFDATPRVLTYTVTPPLSARTDATLTATARFDDALLTDAGSLPLRASLLVHNAPATYVPGAQFQVGFNVTPAPYVQILTIEESIPIGWTPTDISTGGIWDSPNRKIKWGPLIGNQIATATFLYKLTPAVDASQPLSLSATVIFDETAISSVATINRFLAHAANTVVRSLPANYRPSQALTVSLDATPIDTALVYAIEESVPTGWTVSTISNGGSFDETNRRVKWGPFFDAVATARTLTYQVTPPPAAFGMVTFSGAGNFDNQNVAATGANTLNNAPPVVTRALPARYNAGLALTVTVTAAPVPGVLTYAIEEQIPTGWSIASVSDGGAFDSINKKVKWGPFLDGNLRPLTYSVVPPADETGAHNFSGEGFFNGDPVSVTGSTALGPNRAPTAGANSLNRPPGPSFKFSVFALLANDSDLDGDAINIVSVSGVTDFGGTVEFIWPWIYYTAPAGPAAVDTFAYTVADGFGGASVAAITLIPVTPPNQAAQNIVSIESFPDGSALIHFAGVPGFTYHIQTSPDLIAWTTSVDRTANSIGLFEFTDEDAGSATTRFYRTLWP